MIKCSCNRAEGMDRGSWRDGAQMTGYYFHRGNQTIRTQEGSWQLTIETLSLPFIALHHYNTVQVITDNLVRELTEPNYGTENIKYQINKWYSHSAAESFEAGFCRLRANISWFVLAQPQCFVLICVCWTITIPASRRPGRWVSITIRILSELRVSCQAFIYSPRILANVLYSCIIRHQRDDIACIHNVIMIKQGLVTSSEMYSQSQSQPLLPCSPPPLSISNEDQCS